GCVEHIGDVLRPFVFVCTTFGTFKGSGCSKVEQIFTGTPLWIKTSFGNLVSNGDHLTNKGTFAHDTRRCTERPRTWRIFCQLCQISKTTDAIELPPAFQRFRKGNQIDRTTAFLQTRHFSKDMTVWAGVKIICHHTLSYIIPAFVIQH